MRSRQRSCWLRCCWLMCCWLMCWARFMLDDNVTQQTPGLIPGRLGWTWQWLIILPELGHLSWTRRWLTCFHQLIPGRLGWTRRWLTCFYQLVPGRLGRTRQWLIRFHLVIRGRWGWNQCWLACFCRILEKIRFHLRTEMKSEAKVFGCSQNV